MLGGMDTTTCSKFTTHDPRSINKHVIVIDQDVLKTRRLLTRKGDTLTFLIYHISFKILKRIQRHCRPNSLPHSAINGQACRQKSCCSRISMRFLKRHCVFIQQSYRSSTYLPTYINYTNKSQEIEDLQKKMDDISKDTFSLWSVVSPTVFVEIRSFL